MYFVSCARVRSVPKQFFLQCGTFRWQMDKQGTCCCASPQLIHIIVVSPFDISPMLDLSVNTYRCLSSTDMPDNEHCSYSEIRTTQKTESSITIMHLFYFLCSLQGSLLNDMWIIIPGIPPLVETAELHVPQLNVCQSAQMTESLTSVVRSHTRALWKDAFFFFSKS